MRFEKKIRALDRQVSRCGYSPLLGAALEGLHRAEDPEKYMDRCRLAYSLYRQARGLTPPIMGDIMVDLIGSALQGEDGLLEEVGRIIERIAGN